MEESQNIEQSTKISKIILFTVLFILAIALLTVSIILYWLNVPIDPLVFRDQKNQPVNHIVIGNENKEVINGGYIEIMPNFCKTISSAGVVEVEVVGAPSKPTLDWPQEKSSIGCYPNPAVFRLPEFLLLEPRRICFKITYQPNPIRTVEENICTEEFALIEAGKSAQTK